MEVVYKLDALLVLSVSSLFTVVIYLVHTLLPAYGVEARDKC